METIDRWLKSLRLHKYTPLFKRLTYNEMLNLEEKFLIERDITKGARNKILVSVKRLNLRQDQLINMMDDLNQDNISMKEALNVLKEMLITPIPYPSSESATPNSSSPSTGVAVTSDSDYGSISSSISSTSSTISTEESPKALTETPQASCGGGAKAISPPSYYTDPNELTHLFVETFAKVAQRLIESSGYEDSACHGIMAAIVDECLKHNSFTCGQKAIVARFRQYVTKEHKPKTVGYKYHHTQSTVKEQKPKAVGYKHFQQQVSLRQYYQNQLQHHQVQYQRALNVNVHNNHRYQQQSSIHAQGNLNSSNSQHIYHHQTTSQLHQQPQLMHHISAPRNSHHHKQTRHQQPSVSPSSLSISTMGSLSTTSNSDEEERQPFSYREYSLLGPGLTFELPCLRAKADAKKEVGHAHALWQIRHDV